jgi:hypothetical protein
MGERMIEEELGTVPICIPDYQTRARKINAQGNDGSKFLRILRPMPAS